MTKKKLVAFITLAFVIITLISSIALFYAHMPSVDFRLTVMRIQDNIDYIVQSYENKYKTETEFINNFHELSYNANQYGQFPFIYALIEPETGEIVVRNRSYITFYKDWNSERIYLNIEPYLTTEIKKQISDYKKSIKQNIFYIYRMSFNTSTGEYIPVEMELGFYDLYEPCVVKFTNLEADCEIVEEDEFELFNYTFYDLDESAYDHRYYEWLDNHLEERVTEIKAGDYRNTGGGYSGNDKVYFCGSTTIGGKTFVEVFASNHSEYYDTLRYTSFKDSLVIILVLFTLVYGTVFIAASKLYDKNERLNKSLRSFTSAAAHELKTPLAVIQNQCECIIENVAPEKNEEYIKSVYDEAVRMNGIVTNLLQYNRLVNSDKVQKEKCNLKEIVITETEKYKAFAETKGVEMKVALLTEESEIYCNRDLVSMAVDNYLSNAIKYATGEKKVVVTLDGKNFSVYNTSEGIPEEIKKDMWSILSRGSAARTKDGTSSGMGLPICAEIFKAHGYEYGYRNVKDGVEFYFAAK